MRRMLLLGVTCLLGCPPAPPGSPDGTDAGGTVAGADGGGTTPDAGTATGDAGMASDDGGVAFDAGPDPYIPDPVESPAPAVRRLSLIEIENSLQRMVGTVPAALAQVPRDPRDYTFDRVVNAQTVSAAHVEAFDAVAVELAQTLIGGRLLDNVVPACADVIMPPAAPLVTTVTPGSGLTSYPDWALVPESETGDPALLYLRYAPDCGASTSHLLPVDGRYTLSLDVTLNDVFTVALSIDGMMQQSWTTSGMQTLEVELQVAAGAHQVAYDFTFGAGGNPHVRIHQATVVGPLDTGAAMYATERAACADGVMDTLAPLAFRRPITSAERDRLQTLYQGGMSTGGTYAEALSMLLRGIFQSPRFLYLVEVGIPVAGTPGRFALTDWEMAARLSYAVTEAPPDAMLHAAAAAGELRTATQVRAHAQRLLDGAAAQETTARFYRQWLWLDRLPQTAKDPAVYPSFNATLAAAMAQEADTYFRRLTFDLGANVQGLYTFRDSWVDEQLAPVYGIASPGPVPVQTTLPPERSGMMTLPGVLTVTSKFTQTSPVIRGVYVIRNLLCQDLPSPPQNIDVTPPALDPNATSRDRWAAHSADQRCAQCHELIDPVGFTFEEFDAMGRHRTEENGLPIDSSGAILSLGVVESDLGGAADLAAVVGASPEATACLARQWLRFTVGRLEEEPDAPSVGAVAAALSGPGGSLKQGFVALTGTPAFMQRMERTQGVMP